MRYDPRVLLWCLTVFTGGLTVVTGESQGVHHPSYASHPSYLPPQRSQRQVWAKLVMADVINRLGVKLLAIQNEYNENNIAISPYGALSVLIALGEGLQGDSVREIQLAAQIPNDITIIRHGLRDINRDLQSYFIPKEGFLAGLTLNYDSVSLKPQYENILIYYGYDITAFNVALYPPPPKQPAPESTTTTTNLTTTSTITPITTSTTPPTEGPPSINTSTQITERSITVETSTLTTTTQSTTMETSTNPTTATTASTIETTFNLTTATPITTMETSTTPTTATPITTMETSTTPTTTIPISIMETSTTPTIATATSTTEPSSTPTTVTPITTVETGTTTSDTMTTEMIVLTAEQPVTTIISTTSTGEPSKISTTSTIIPNTTSPSSTNISTTNITRIDPITAYSSNSTMSTTPSFIKPNRTINTNTRSAAFLALSNLTSVNLSKLRQFDHPLTGTETGTNISEILTESTTSSTSAEPISEQGSSLTTTLPTTQNMEAMISTQATELLTNMPTTELSVQLTTEEETTEYKMESTTEEPVELASADITEASIQTEGTTEQVVLSSEAMTEETMDQETTESVTDETTEQQISTTEALTENSMATTEALTTEEMTENLMEQQLATTDATMTALGFAGSPKQKRMTQPSPISLNKWSWTNKTPSRRVAKSVSEYVKYQKPFYYTTYSYPRPIKPSMNQEPPYFLVQGRFKEYQVNFMRYNTMLPVCNVAHLDARALKFPLDRKEYYLLILLPNREDGVDKLLRDLRFNGDLRQIVDGLRTMHVDVTIPSFKMSGYVRLTPLFQRLGIKKVFEPNQADFTPMTDQKQIYVTSIEQAITVNIKHYVDIESMIRKSSYPWEFKANHPFLFFVMDSELQVSLMSGKITNPLNTRIS